MSLFKLIQMSRNFPNFSCTKNILSLIIQILKVCWTKYPKLCQRVLTNKRHTWLKPWLKNRGLKRLVLIREDFKGTWLKPLLMELFWWSNFFKQINEKKIAKKSVTNLYDCKVYFVYTCRLKPYLKKRLIISAMLLLHSLSH